ncbi:MAG: DUF2586 domain-containing protein [Bacteroidales bacterium]|nr:DUF2586 domain-containing protein [Bacteroidales bacterium]
MLNDINITKLSGGLGRREPNNDMVSALVANGVAVSGGVQLNTVYRLNSLNDAIALKIDASYDSTNNILLYEHIKEYFRINPSGELWLLVPAQSVSYADMVDKTNVNGAKKVLNEAEGKIRLLAVAYNPSIPVSDFSDTQAAITKAQELAVDEYNNHRPIEVLLEGKGFSLTNQTNLRNLNAPNVAVMVGQNLAIANAHTNFNSYAAIGTLLGAVSKASVNECVAWVEKFNVLGDNLTVPAIAKTKFSDIAAGVVNTTNDNGYIFFRTHTGKAGIYFNDSFTCTSLTDDYAYIENNRTVHKAVRNIRTVLLPRLAMPVNINPNDGTISPEIIKQFENDGKRALEQMISDGEISSMDILIDPFQNILATSELKVQFSIVPTGTARKINVTIGFNNLF